MIFRNNFSYISEIKNTIPFLLICFICSCGKSSNSTPQNTIPQNITPQNQTDPQKNDDKTPSTSKSSQFNHKMLTKIPDELIIGIPFPIEIEFSTSQDSNISDFKFVPSSLPDNFTDITQNCDTNLIVNKPCIWRVIYTPRKGDPIKVYPTFDYKDNLQNPTGSDRMDIIWLSLPSISPENTVDINAPQGFYFKPVNSGSIITNTFTFKGEISDLNLDLTNISNKSKIWSFSAMNGSISSDNHFICSSYPCELSVSYTDEKDNSSGSYIIPFTYIDNASKQRNGNFGIEYQATKAMS